MSRLNTFEFEDFAWFPHILRDATTDFLRSSIQISNIYQCIFPKIKQTLLASKSTNIVDLCSGGGGPHCKLMEYLQADSSEGRNVQSITLTDLNPNIGAFQRLSASNEKIKYIDTPVNAKDVDKHLQGMRTLFTSFHHMDPDTAEKILADTILSQQAIGIFELSERTTIAVIRIIIIGFLFSICLVPFSKPFSWKKLLVSPIAILTTWWDGISSCLRTYSVKEMQDMVDKVDKNNEYHWEIGKKFSWLHLCNISYLIGYKKD